MKYIKIGIDEAGRGCWSGSVFAAAVFIPNKNLIKDLLPLIKDSKKLSEKQRFSIFEEIKSRNIIFSVSKKESWFIDQNNILYATLLAMEEAALDLIKKLCYEVANVKIFIDGNSALPDKQLKSYPIVKGDSKVLEISLASIIAKCHKDLESLELDRLYPQYGFGKHKGYGTVAHKRAIKEFGITEFHRKSYKPIKKLLQEKSSLFD